MTAISFIPGDLFQKVYAQLIDDNDNISQDNLAVRLAYSAANTALIEFIGCAEAGASTAEAKWQIQKLERDAGDNIITIVWSDGNTLLDNIWINRDSLSYS